MPFFSVLKSLKSDDDIQLTILFDENEIRVGAEDTISPLSSQLVLVTNQEGVGRVLIFIKGTVRKFSQTTAPWETLIFVKSHIHQTAYIYGLLFQNSRT